MAHTALLRASEDAVHDVAPLRRLHAPACYQYRVAPSPVGGLTKRAFDVIVAGSALLALSPFLLIVAALVRLESEGPALYRQKRTGFRGRAFTILKFRTMKAMEDGRQLTQAQPGDARVTMLGRFLRRTSIDELPQLINVVRGDMSLVGPRPHAVMHDRDFFDVDNEYPRRFLARPGITGAAQVAGARGVTDTPEKVLLRLRHDLDYVDRWGLWRDIAILLATVSLLLGDRNAC
jgi:putative colanic acid biosynthesis UDP-glucose lipid carrier transferase